MEKRLIKIAMNAMYGTHEHIGRGLINNYRKLHGLPLCRKKNKKKRRYTRYPRCEFFTTILQLKPMCMCEICGRPLSNIRQDISSKPCLCDTCYNIVKDD